MSEGSSVILICEGTRGNPPEVLSYSWSFEPRYEVESPLSSSTDKELEFENVQYTQAGMYRCDADNGAGVGTGEKEVFVQCKYSMTKTIKFHCVMSAIRYYSN